MTEENKEPKETEESESSELAKKKDDTDQPPAPPTELMTKELFEQLPPEAKKNVSKMFSMIMASGPMPHPIFSKMTSEHVGKVIENIEKESVRDHEDRMSARKWNFGTLIVVLVFILALAAGCLWKDKLEYIAPIITALIGGVGGYGIGLSQGKKNA